MWISRKMPNRGVSYKLKQKLRQKKYKQEMQAMFRGRGRDRITGIQILR